MTQKLTNQLIDVTSGRNFRELGGYETNSGKKIKMHKLLRTGNLADLSPFDKQFLTDYGVKYDVDFRSKEEVERQPDRVPDGVEYIYDPVFSEDLTNSSKSINDLNTQASDDADFGFNHMHYAYEDMIESESAQKAYRKFFDVLLKNDVEGESVIFHCTAGKDRTGFGALQSVRAEYIDHAVKIINDDYGSIHNYLRDMMKLSSADIMKLRNIYLED